MRTGARLGGYGRVGGVMIALGMCISGCPDEMGMSRSDRPLPVRSAGEAPAERPGDKAVNEAQVNQLDLLFVIDNSQSMIEEQAALSKQLPRLVASLMSGDRDHDGAADIPKVQSLHVGVVSTDMGIPNVRSPEILRCSAQGDDARLSPLPRVAPSGMCREDLPAFASLDAGDDAEPFFNALTCAAHLGTGGCGFEQQLEAALKALWPSRDAAGQPHPAPPGGAFVAPVDVPEGAFGRGDRENEGFLRDAPDAPPSLLAVVLVSDEEDCSSLDTQHFTAPADVPPGSPLLAQDLNLRCFFNKPNLFPIERYVDGLKALRPGREDLVLFAAIVGVPGDLVSEAARATVDFGDAAHRDAFYDRMLEDPRMVETIEPGQPGERNLKPSCATDQGLAYPPRRIVEVARGFGEAGLIQSICEADFQPAIDALVDGIAARLQQLGAKDD